MKKFSITDLLIFIVSAELTGAVSALIAGGFTSLYAEIRNPPLSPPGWVFPVVWTLLYALMGLGAYLVFRREDSCSDRSTALGLYVIQLGVNFLWSILFFRFRLFGVSAFTALILLLLVLAMILNFRKVSRTAALINVPYLLWLAFAAYLSFGVWILN
ncbi:MAG: tryptophan-rich sensory protein [Ruminococcus sp.]|nr:tryptophan-rich sensory protein [Ruminococcus sp.]